MSLRALLPGMLLVLCLSASGQEENKTSYQDLLVRVKKMDPKVDFTAFRMAYTQTADYNPYDEDRDNREGMRGAFRKKDFHKAVKHADKLLSKNYVDIEAHRIASSAHAELKNNEQVKFHAYVRDGLVQSILKSGDGKSPKTAFVVIATSEEYALMDALGVRPLSQGLMQEQGHKYDRQDGKDEKNRPITLYFNIDRPFRWLENSFKKKD